jgi:hypothetical protein
MSEEPLFQISLDTIHSGNTCQNFHSKEAYSKELQHFRESLLKSCSQWPPEYNTSASPYPLLIPESHIKHIERLGNALCRSVTSIVERWWTDPIAGFPQRMPVLPHQETILRVIIRQIFEFEFDLISRIVDRRRREGNNPTIFVQTGGMETRFSLQHRNCFSVERDKIYF